MANERARALGFDFVTDDKYLRSPFKAPVQGGGEDASTESFGIPYTNAFTNSGGGGGGGGNYTGSSYGLPGDFNTAIKKRAKRIQNPSKIAQFAYDHVPGINQPQSEEDIIEYGYQKPKMGIPIGITSLLSRFGVNTFDQLPQSSQAFITSQKGYKGPTVFGENTGGGNVDPFGLNIESMFGNYDKAVEKDYNKLSKSLTEEGGAVFDKYNKAGDLEWDEELGKYTAGSQMKKANEMTKMLRSRLGLRFNQTKKQEQIDDKLAQQSIDEGKAYTASLANAPQHHQDVSINRGDHQAQNINDLAEDQGSGVTASSGMHGGKHYAKGGRAGYFFGGRARLQGGGMSQGKEANIDQSTNMGGGASGDYSTMEQNMNHREAMRNNQREQPSTLNNTIDTGSELNYLNNLKNLNLPGLALGFGFNKIRNYLGNKKDEDDKLSALPTNNYMADLNAAQIKQLEGPQKMGKEYGNFSDQDILDNITPFGDEETAPATLKDVQTFYGSNGGRVNFKNGGLAGIL